MPLDFSGEALNYRIDALRSGFAAHALSLKARGDVYLKAYSPPYEPRIREHDQWQDPILPNDEGYTRSSYNIVRATVEKWTSLEAADFPAIRWIEDYIPLPPPSLDEAESARRQTVYRAEKLVSQRLSTMREQGLARHMRRSRLAAHWWDLTLRKNLYGHAWMRSVPDRSGRRFVNTSRIDPATVFPVWSAFGEPKLDSLLVGYRRSARQANALYPDAVQLSRDGITVEASDYRPGPDPTTDPDRAFVWVEDYWALDDTFEEATDSEPITSLVVNAIRVNGKLVQRVTYPGWTRVPYFRLANESERDQLGLSDAATVLPFQDALNRMLSQQQDVIYGESRPRYVYRGDATRQIVLDEFGSVISLDPDEFLDRLDTTINTYPTQVHGQQLLQMLRMATGLPAVVWGEITAAQNSGRALSTAWRAVATSLIPRINSASLVLTDLLTFWIDCMELYGWDSARDLYSGNRDFEVDWPNKEPRDFLEVTTDALNRLNGGITDRIGAMELTGEKSPDELLERVKADYLDEVLNPEKALSYALLQRQRNQVEIEARQAGLQEQVLLQQMQTSGPSADQAQGQAKAQQSAAAAQAAPNVPSGTPMPATQAGAPANAGSEAEFSTLVQQGRPAMNRIIERGPI
jgi:hypothetical protein